jgi:hypothetical protein
MSLPFKMGTSMIVNEKNLRSSFSGNVAPGQWVIGTNHPVTWCHIPEE